LLAPLPLYFLSHNALGAFAPLYAARVAASLLSTAALATGWERHARRAVHSTQTDDLASANDLMVGFVLMAVADELVRLGDRSMAQTASWLVS